MPQFTIHNVAGRILENLWAEREEIPSPFFSLDPRKHWITFQFPNKKLKEQGLAEGIRLWNTQQEWIDHHFSGETNLYKTNNSG